MKWVTRWGVRECMQGIESSDSLLTKHLLGAVPSLSLSTFHFCSSYRPLVFFLLMLKIISGLERKANELFSAWL